MTIKGLQRKVSAVNTDKIINETIDESREVLADLNVEQMNKGLRADGSLMPDYSNASVEVYGKPEGPIRLRDTGEFQEDVFARRSGEDIIFGSTDQKAEMLEAQFGKQIYTLEEKFQAEAQREKIRPTFKKKIEAATGLKMK